MPHEKHSSNWKILIEELSYWESKIKLNLLKNCIHPIRIFILLVINLGWQDIIYVSGVNLLGKKWRRMMWKMLLMTEEAKNMFHFRLTLTWKSKAIEALITHSGKCSNYFIKLLITSDLLCTATKSKQKHWDRKFGWDSLSMISKVEMELINSLSMSIPPQLKHFIAKIIKTNINFQKYK